jgi:hypothetical protein
MRAGLGLVLVLLGPCRPGAVVSETDGAMTVRPDPNEALSDDEVQPEREPDAVESPDEPADTDESPPCELACADVYACLLAEGRPDTEAASIELGCLAACVASPDAFARCERPGSIGPDTCAGYLACARRAWSNEERPPTIIDPSDGCGRACGALARCHEAPLEAAEECAKECRELDDAELERRAGECAALEGCEAIEQCVMALPGA